jgi:hypothetical protein
LYPAIKTLLHPFCILVDVKVLLLLPEFNLGFRKSSLGLPKGSSGLPKKKAT